MRIGYAATVKEVAWALEGVRSPFNTSVLAQEAARAALDDVDHVIRSRSENRREVAFLSSELSRRGIRFVPTVANFLLVFTSGTGEQVYQALLRLGIIVRPMEAYGYTHAVRVSVGTRPENERLLGAIDQASSGILGKTPDTHRVS
jgi:histidinol-phosphate aminotransferase